MSTESALAFAERLKTDQAFVTKLAEASKEERRALAKAEGFDLSDDDLGTVRQTLGFEELSDEDLERVAGGTGATTTVLYSAASAFATVVAAAGGSNTTTITVATAADTVVITIIVTMLTSSGQ